jgi:hypothetical protein
MFVHALYTNLEHDSKLLKGSVASSSSERKRHTQQKVAHRLLCRLKENEKRKRKEKLHCRHNTSSIKERRW